MTFEVRDPMGILLGHIDVLDVRWLRRGSVRFVRALNVPYYGPGLLDDVPPSAEDISFQSVDMAVQMYAHPPVITDDGEYRPGRCDFYLQWDGPMEALRDVRRFRALPVRHEDSSTQTQETKNDTRVDGQL